MHTYIHRVSEIKLSETEVTDTYTSKRLIITSKDMVKARKLLNKNRHT